MLKKNGTNMNFATSFVENPMLYNYILDDKGALDDIYKAVSALDMSGAVLNALKVMRTTKTLPQIEKYEKSKDRSCIYRNKGNIVYTSQCYQKALEWYNKALLFAPKGSVELLHAYSNRSALLLKLSAYAASLHDIETCFKLGCTGDLSVKLNKRKEECEKMIWKEHLKNSILKSTFTQEFFKLKGKRHPEIPCLSADCDVISESEEKNVVAVKDLKVGTLIALETAFATHSCQNKSYVTCYYCQKMTFNLMPCENCCFALFCSEKCRELCFNEYHQIECQIMNVLETVDRGFKFRVTVKTILKIKNQCKLWSALIEESNNIGTGRFKSSSINQIYNSKNWTSILCYKENRHFVHGTMYNASFAHATLIHHLEKICGFFPVLPADCLKAKKCLAKLSMTLELMWPFTTEIENAVEDLNEGHIVTDVPFHYGWFSFIGKLNHSCEPNVLALGLNNRVGLVVIKPIKKMTEIKVSYIGHWYQHLYEKERTIKIFQFALQACTCRVCKGCWGIHTFDKIDLNHLQKKVYRAWDQVKDNMMFQDQSNVFKETCKALATFDELVNTKEQYEIFRELRTQLSLCQFAASENTMLNHM